MIFAHYLLFFIGLWRRILSCTVRKQNKKQTAFSVFADMFLNIMLIIIASLIFLSFIVALENFIFVI